MGYDVTLTGADSGGTVTIDAGGAYAQDSEILVTPTGTLSSGGEVDISACTLTVNGTAHVEATGATAGHIQLTGRNLLTVNASSVVRATGSGGSVRLITRNFSVCSNDLTRNCRSNTDCTIGCSTGTCQNPNPNTGGSTAQFDPAPTFIENSALASCP